MGVSPPPPPTPRASVHLPVVISVIPVVKVHQKAIVHHVSHCGNTDQGRVHAVHSLELHAHLEAWGSLMLAGKRGRAFSELQPQLLPHHLLCLLQGGTSPNPPKTRLYLTSRQAWDHSASQMGSVLLCKERGVGVSDSAGPHKERGKITIFRPSGSSVSSKFQEEKKPLTDTSSNFVPKHLFVITVSSDQCLRHGRRSWDGALLPFLPLSLGSRICAKHCITHTGGVVAATNNKDYVQ